MDVHADNADARMTVPPPAPEHDAPAAPVPSPAPAPAAPQTWVTGQVPVMVPPPAEVPPAAQANGGIAFTPMSTKSRRRVKRSVIAVVALAVLAGVGVLSVMFANWTRTPEATVRQYLDYLAAGKASAATAMADPGLANDKRAFLTDDVMAAADARIVIEDIVADTNEDAKTRTVTATMQLDGERFTYNFTVSSAKPTFGVLKNWKLENSLVMPVRIMGEKVSKFSVGEVTTSVPAGEMTIGTEFVFYPGIYTLTPVDLGEYVDADPVTLRVKPETGSGRSGDTAQRVQLKGDYNSKLTDAALSAAVALTNSCATVPGNIDQACPSSVRATNLSVLQVKKVPATMKKRGDDGSFTGEAVFSIQSTSSWDKEPHDVDSTVTATVMLDENGAIKTDASGEPQFKVSFGY